MYRLRDVGRGLVGASTALVIVLSSCGGSGGWSTSDSDQMRVEMCDASFTNEVWKNQCDCIINATSKNFSSFDEWSSRELDPDPERTTKYRSDLSSCGVDLPL